MGSMGTVTAAGTRQQEFLQYPSAVWGISILDLWVNLENK